MELKLSIFCQEPLPERSFNPVSIWEDLLLVILRFLVCEAWGTVVGRFFTLSGNLLELEGLHGRFSD
jgi:hypothetical protein